MRLRCPYCHEAVISSAPCACARCGAVHHPACGLELGRCAACGADDIALGALDLEGWERVAAGASPASPHVGFRRITPRTLPPLAPDPSPHGDQVRLRLDVLRRHLCSGGVLAGEVELIVPTPTALGALTLELSCQRTRAGWLGLRTRSELLRRLPLLGRTERGWIRRGPRGLYAPGSYLARFRLPLAGVPTTVDGPGVPQIVSLQLTAKLERRRSLLEARLELRVDSGHVSDRAGVEGPPLLSPGPGGQPRRVPLATDGAGVVLGGSAAVAGGP